MESTMVIKVKYGDTLRRFNVRVDENEKLDLDIDGLRAKILALFNFPPDADLMLTYIDEDGDIVTLVDDDDLCDVMRQHLKFLRIDVQLNNEKFGKAYSRSSGSSTPLRSPHGQLLSPDINNKLAELLKCVPEPMREALSKLSSDFVSKASSSTPMFADLVEGFLKMGVSHQNKDSQSQSGAESSGYAEASVPKYPNASKDGGLREVLPKLKAVDSTSKSSQEVDVGVLRTPIVDLNLVPPIEFVPGGTLLPAVSNFNVNNDQKDAKEKNNYPSGKSAVSFVSTSSADPARPSDVNQPRATDLSGNSSSECPFSGMPLATDPAGMYGHPSICRFKRSINRDVLVGMFHKGVRCDGCGVHPISGPRFKSKVKEDYDLCTICFAAMGNETDYIRMDRPEQYRHPRPLRGLCNQGLNYWRGSPAVSHIQRGCRIKPRRSNLDSCFISDVNVLDGTRMAPSAPFTKIWRVRNSGTSVWPRGTQLVWIGADRFTDEVSVEIEVPADGVPVEGELDIAVDFTAPELPGRYISYWMMASPSGVKYGQQLWVLIEVDWSLKNSNGDNFQCWNLNLPPESNRSKRPEIIDMNVQPIADGGFQEPLNSYTVGEPVKLVVDEQPKKDQELNSPMNDSLLVGHGASSSASPSSPQGPSVSYPIIDLTETDLTVPSSHAHSSTSVPTSSNELSDKDAVEQSLLKELEEMGFKQVDLNKEILRMNEYDFQQSVDDLCGVAEWDPILEELQEMGFCDQERNKRLLKKNNGSMKRVVMDLLTGEKS